MRHDFRLLFDSISSDWWPMTLQLQPVISMFRYNEHIYEPRASGIVGDCSANWATSNALFHSLFDLCSNLSHAFLCIHSVYSCFNLRGFLFVTAAVYSILNYENSRWQQTKRRSYLFHIVSEVGLTEVFNANVIDQSGPLVALFQANRFKTCNEMARLSVQNLANYNNENLVPNSKINSLT